MKNKTLLILLGLFVFLCLICSSVTFLFVKQNPWITTFETACNFSNCFYSIDNSKYVYWKNKSIKEKNIDLCQNAGTIDEGDYTSDGVFTCHYEYAVQLNDLRACERLKDGSSLSGEYYVLCLSKIGKAIDKTNVLNKEICSAIASEFFTYENCVIEMVKLTGNHNDCFDLEHSYMLECVIGASDEEFDWTIQGETTAENVDTQVSKCFQYESYFTRQHCLDEIAGLYGQFGDLMAYCSQNTRNSAAMCFNFLPSYLDGKINYRLTVEQSDRLISQLITLADSNAEMGEYYCNAIIYDTLWVNSLTNKSIQEHAEKKCGISYLE